MLSLSLDMALQQCVFCSKTREDHDQNPLESADQPQYSRQFGKNVFDEVSDCPAMLSVLSRGAYQHIHIPSTKRQETIFRCLRFRLSFICKCRAKVRMRYLYHLGHQLLRSQDFKGALVAFQIKYWSTPTRKKFEAYEDLVCSDCDSVFIYKCCANLNLCSHYFKEYPKGSPD